MISSPGTCISKQRFDTFIQTSMVVLIGLAGEDSPANKQLLQRIQGSVDDWIRASAYAMSEEVKESIKLVTSDLSITDLY